MKLEENIEKFFKNASAKPAADFNLYNVVLEELQKYEQALIVEREAPGEDVSINLAWDGIPFLSADEIGWGGGSTKSQNATDSRKQIERFLKQVGAQRYDVKSKLKYLEAFFSKSEATGAARQSLKAAGVNLDDPRQTIAKILSYLTFYKTLTMILQNFNAASAGFTFESFVAVLLGGKQVPTGNQTIADLTAKSGRPISLKLLDEKSATVEGSLRDLVNDFAGLGSKPVSAMRYIVVLKDLQGDGPELEGVIKFYQFDYTIDTILHYLTIPTGEQENNLRLPVSVIQGQEEEEIPAARAFGELWSENFDEALEQAKQEIEPPEGGWPEETRDAVLSGFDESGKAVSRGWKDRAGIIHTGGAITARINKAGNPVLADLKPYVNLQNEVHRIVTGLAAASKGEFDVATKARTRFQAAVQNYAPNKESIEYLRSIQSDPEVFWKTMMKTYGYVNKKQWGLTRTAIQRVPEESDEKAYLGRLFIGRAVLEEMVNMCRDTINEKVFEIFRELKVLTENLQAYFAEGMQNNVADQAIQASENIGEKTAEVAKETGAEEP